MYRIDEPRLGGRRLTEWRRRGKRLVGLLLGAIAILTLGVWFLDSTTAPPMGKLQNAVWNAVNLIATLGSFADLNVPQKLFLSLGAVVAMIFVGYAITTLSGVLSSDAVTAFRENRAMSRKLDQLSSHVVIATFGPVGRLVAGHVRQLGETVLIIDIDEKRATEATEDGYLAICGDPGSFDKVIGRAQLDMARSLLLTGTDATHNLAITLMARTVNPALEIVVFSDSDLRRRMLLGAGATTVVDLDDIVARTFMGHLGGGRRP
ncbi:MULTISPECIES: potassium channel family protein [Dyella]|uniref:Potassium transporter TrkA n=2 Tax=Dyella TaxID=231454 RepID=A0A4R0YYK6_9GAMM|nr:MULTISPECIES: NAD(P)-binding protein [Dyella]TBR40300.1 potassium transporter TrkA [Dyella terrae]TCI12118.1 potassium transporter TrkA [Dyella soli]